MGAVLVISCDHDPGFCDETINGFVRWITDDHLSEQLIRQGWKEVKTQQGSDDYYFCPKHCSEEPTP